MEETLPLDFMNAIPGDYYVKINNKTLKENTFCIELRFTLRK
jgi:hypothetical protein